MVSENADRLAVLIDADNAQPAIAEGLLAEVAKYGTAHVKRAYGDWTGTSLKGWKDQLLAQSIQPIQQFAYTSGKNSTDAAMVIDAMDLLYSDRLDGFCLVSSDSDFTRLAARIRESGLTVDGFGERKTPKPFVAACDKFIYIENLSYTESAGTSTDAVPKPAPRATAAQLQRDAALVSQLRHAVEAASGDDGWAALAYVGQILTNRSPDFDSRTWGYAKLSDLVTATKMFDMENRGPGDGKPGVIFVREKRRQATLGGRGRLRRVRVVLVMAQVLDVDELVARRDERGGRLPLAESVDGQAGLTDTRGQPGEVAVAGHDAEPVEPPRVQQVHRVDDHRGVGGVLAPGVGELLDRLD